MVLFKSYTPDDLYAVAEARQKVARSAKMGDSDVFVSMVTPEEIVFNDTESEMPEYEPMLTKALDLDHSTSGSTYMRSYLSQSRENIVLELARSDDQADFEKETILRYIPNGAPLLDHIRVRADYLPGWDRRLRPILTSISEMRGLDDNTASIPVREIVLGRSSDEEVEEWVKWMNAHTNSVYQRFPTSFMPVVTKKLYVFNPFNSGEIFGRIPDVPFEKAKQATCTELGCTSSFISLILLGSSTTVGVIRMPIQTTGSGENLRFTYESGLIIQPALREYLATGILVSFGAGIRETLYELKCQIKYNHLPTGDGCLTIGSNSCDVEYLAYWAGILNPRSSMWFYSFLCTGCAPCTWWKVDHGDGEWYKPIAELPDSLKIYLIGEVRHAYNVSIVLTISCLLDAFPDMVAACQLSGLEPRFLLKYFCTALSLQVVGKVCSPAKAAVAGSRTDLILSIDEERSIAYSAEDTTFTATEFAALVEDKPSIPYGGVRFLHQARLSEYLFSKLATEKQLLQSVRWKGMLDFHAKNFILLGQFPEDEKYDWNTAPISSLGLGLFPGLKFTDDPLSEFEPTYNGTTKSEFIQMRNCTGRTFRSRMIEAALLDPDIIRPTLRRAALPFNHKDKLLLTHPKSFKDLDSIYTLIFDEWSGVDPPLSQSVNKVRGSIASAGAAVDLVTRKRKELEDALELERLAKKKVEDSVKELSESTSLSLSQVRNRIVSHIPKKPVQSSTSISADTSVDSSMMSSEAAVPAKLSKGQRQRRNRKLKMLEYAEAHRHLQKQARN